MTTFDELTARIAKLEDKRLGVDDLPMAQLQRWLGQRWLADAVADVADTSTRIFGQYNTGNWTLAAGAGTTVDVSVGTEAVSGPYTLVGFVADAAATGNATDWVTWSVYAPSTGVLRFKIANQHATVAATGVIFFSIIKHL